MAYIDTKYLGKCETCRHLTSGGCNTYCDHGEEYSPNLSKIPIADVVPKIKGKWKPYKDHFSHRQVGWICTKCSSVISDVSNGDTDYCPHCGAVMETEVET